MPTVVYVKMNGTTTSTISLTSVSYRDMVSIIGGTYTQKTEDGQGGFEHTISSFYMGKYEVTYELWYTVRQWALSNGYTFASPGREGHDGTEGAAPSSAKYESVSSVNWRDTIIWCNAYSEITGLTPVYYTDRGFTTPLYDMSGNVWEFCWDWYNVTYPGTSTDYRGPGSGSARVLRGGSFGNGAYDCLVDLRNNINHYDEYFNIGFRLARSQ